MKRILIIGGSGQLGQELTQCLLSFAHQFQVMTPTHAELDITSSLSISIIASMAPNFVINCAAYTAVDKAETDIKQAFSLNATAAKNVAEASLLLDIPIIHISTDFVFNGLSSLPYIETDVCDPINIYGASKLEGEKLIIATNPKHFVIRTSWLYSSFGNNFLKNITRYAQERDMLNVVFDQVGTPTYTKDLAQAIHFIIEANTSDFGIYHYSNEGVASWYDFAKVLVDKQQIRCDIHPILTAAYPTPAKRPAFSVLNKQKIKSTFSIVIPYWQDSLSMCIEELRQKEYINQ
jgi:dTDP-4-dehydrorhamnose reductase